MAATLSTSGVKSGLLDVFSNTSILTSTERGNLYGDDVATPLYNTINGFSSTNLNVTLNATVTNTSTGATAPVVVTAKILEVTPTLNSSLLNSYLKTTYKNILDTITVEPRPANQNTYSDLEADMISQAVTDLLITNATWTYTATLTSVSISTLPSLSISGTLTVSQTGKATLKSTIKSSLISAYGLIGDDLKNSNSDTQANTVSYAYLSTSSPMTTFFGTFAGTDSTATVTPNPALDGINSYTWNSVSVTAETFA